VRLAGRLCDFLGSICHRSARTYKSRSRCYVSLKFCLTQPVSTTALSGPLASCRVCSFPLRSFRYLSPPGPIFHDAVLLSPPPFDHYFTPLDAMPSVLSRFLCSPAPLFSALGFIGFGIHTLSFSWVYALSPASVQQFSLLVSAYDESFFSRSAAAVGVFWCVSAFLDVIFPFPIKFGGASPLCTQC